MPQMNVKMTATTPQHLRDMADLLEQAGVGTHETLPANGGVPTLRVSTREAAGLGPLVEFGLWL